MNQPKQIPCAHGYILMQDSCPGCDAQGEEKHPPRIVEVQPSWSSNIHKRCLDCGQVKSARVHR